MLPFCHLFSPVPHSLRRAKVLGRCRSTVVVVEAQKQRGKQGKGKGKNKAPRSEVRCVDGRNPQILLLPQPPSQASRTIQCTTIPCHFARSRLPSLTLSCIFHVLAQESHQTSSTSSPGQTTAGRPAIKPYGGLLSACMCAYPSPPVLQSAVSRKMLTAACPRRTMPAQQLSLHDKAVRSTV
jgi:hypothetical protein